MLRAVCAGLIVLGTWSRDARAAVTPITTVGVGQQSAAVSVTVHVSGNGTAAAPQVVTQGVPALDFSIVSGGSCVANAVYVSGNTCTVNVVFAPKYPGLRSGAVVLKGVDGSVLGTALVGGVATGSLSVLNPGRIDTVAGDGELNYRTDGVLATYAPIFLPYGVVVDISGNIYLSDTNNSRIRRVDAQSGLISTIAGIGSAGYSGDGGPAIQAAISQPGGLTLDGAGDIYFADSGNAIIRRIDAFTGVMTTVAGTPLTQGYTGDGMAATTATLSSPRGVAFDPAGNLYIADTSNNVIREVDATTGRIGTVAGTGFAGYSLDNVLAVTAELNSPWTVSVGADNSLYIADLSNNRIRKVSGGVISTVAGNGSRGFMGDASAATSAELNNPASVVVDPAGDLYIADSGNSRVRKVYASTGVINTLTGSDSEQFSGDGGPANQATIYAPYALFFDQSGNLFIADTLHNRIRRILATPVALVYPVMRVNKLSIPQIQGLENDGNSGLNLATPMLNNAALDPATTTCSFAVAVASSAACNLGVEFAPTVVGNDVMGAVTLNSDAGNTPTIINVSGQVLSVEPTTVSLLSNINPSLIAQTVTFTATVASDDPNRSGPVTFLDGTTVVCSNVALSAGSASCGTSTLALGQHNVTASYAGDDNNAASVSAVLVQVVKQQPTLTLAASPNPASVTQSVTLTFAASATSGTPSGSVVFYDGSTALSGNISLNASGAAIYSTTTLTPGQHSLSAQYAGDVSNASGQSNVVKQAISQIASSTTLSSSNPTFYVGTQVTFTASVDVSTGPAPTGTVQFADGEAALGTSPVDSNGHAALVISTLSPGVHQVVAAYSGDTDDTLSSSSPMLETVQQIPTATTLISDMNPASAGSTIHLSATVTLSGSVAADGVIAGTITFSEGNTVLGTAQVNSAGVASIAVSTLAVGQHNIVASYPGSTNYAASTSTTFTQTITSTASTTVLTDGTNSSLAGKPVTLSVTVTSPTGVPTGNVIFRDGMVNIGQGLLNAQGNAVLSTSSLSAGTHALSATYQGDGNYTASTSAVLTQTVSIATTGLTLGGPGNPVDVGTAVTLTAALSSSGVAPTGALSLRDGNAVVATQNVSGTGSFPFSTSTLAIGTHLLIATYAGDANNSSANSNAITVTVQQAATATSLATSANPSSVGQSLTLTAAVTSTGPNVTGTVTFEDSGTVLGSVSLNASGSATLNTATLSFGPHTLTAVYDGDTNHAVSSSAAVNEQIVQVPSVALSSSNNPSITGTGVVFTVKVSGVGALTPTGSVILSDGGSALTTVSLDPTGTSSFQSTALAVGSHSIAANYSGDKNYAGMTVSLIQTVQSAETQISLTGSANPAIYGMPLSLTATIVSNGGVATGTVTFTDGGNALGSAVLSSGGVATLTTTSLAPGPHSIVVNYAGDGRASGSASTPLVVTVRQLTSVAVATSANPALTLSSIVLTATVTSGVTTPTGTVVFSEGSTQLGSAQLDATGHAVLTLASLSAGNHSIIASYGGDNNDFASVSAVLTQGVQLRATTTALTASATDPSNSQQVTLIGIVRWTGPTVPTGVVTFTSGSTVIGTGSIDASGAATLNIIVDLNSSEVIVANYNGDAAYASSASLATSVTGGAASQFTLSLNPSSITIQSKQHTVVSLTSTSIKSFSDTLQFGCLGLPFAATCTFSNVQMPLAANGTGMVQLTIDTGDPLGAGAVAKLTRPEKATILTCFLPGFVLAGVALFYRRRLSLQGLLLLLCAVALTLSASGCAGLQMNGTPAGTYAFKVTASGLGSGVTESQVINLTVTP